MRLAIPFTLLMGSYVAAAPSIQHAQISVEVTDVDAYDQVDALHASEELVINNGRPAFKSLPFNFTVRARQVYSPLSLPFGFKNLDAPSGFARGELGFRTEFAFRNGKLINGNRALGYHVARIFPPWTSLWSLKDDVQFLELVATSQHSGGRVNHFLELEKSGEFTSIASILFFFIHSMVWRR